MAKLADESAQELGEHVGNLVDDLLGGLPASTEPTSSPMLPETPQTASKLLSRTEVPFRTQLLKKKSAEVTELLEVPEELQLLNESGNPSAHELV